MMIYKYFCLYLPTYISLIIIDLVDRVFTNGLGDQDSIPGQVIPKT